MYAPGLGHALTLSSSTKCLAYPTMKNKMSKPLTYNEIKLALMSSPNNKVAGLNGLPTDLFKELHKAHKQNSEQNKPSFDIVNLLRAAYNDVKSNGITAPDIQDGWLCPLYKKRDHCKIINYHPITVLNSKYKYSHQ